MTNNLPVRLDQAEIEAAKQAGYVVPTRKKDGFFGGMWSFFPTFFGRPTFWPMAGQARGPVNAAGSDSGQTVTPNSALTLSAVWACTWLVARTIATIPLDVKRQSANGKMVNAIDLDLYDLLRWQPNDRMTASDFWMCMLCSLQLWGNGYARKLRGVSGALIGLDPLRPEWMTVYMINGKVRYRYDEPNNPQDFAAADIWHLKDRTIDGLVGASVIEFGRNSFGLAQSGESAAGKTFKNGMQASGYLLHDKFLTPVQRALIHESIAEFGAGGSKTGGTMVLEGAFKDYKQLSLKPLDAELLASREFSVTDVARWFGVPPIMIGHTGDVTMWGCLTGESLVFTEAGPQPIKDVKVGAKVWAHHDGRLALKKVLRSGQTGIRSVRTINTRTQSLSATDNHEFFVRRKFAAPRAGFGGYRAVEWRNVWVRADELTTSDYLIVAHDLPVENTAAMAPNGRIVSESFMEFCGLYIAEGSMSSGYVSVARGDGAQYMDAYRQAIRQCFTKVNGDTVVTKEKVRSTGFSSATAVKEMLDLGFGGVASTKRVPGWIFGLAKPLVIAFLRGYLDGDGTVNERGWITWTSVHRALIDDVRHLCILAGIPVGKSKGYPINWGYGDRPRRKPGTVWQAWSFDIEANRKIKSHDPRYQERLAMAQTSQRIGRFSPEYVGRGAGGSRPGPGFKIDGAVISRVISITEQKEEVPVFDIEVEDAHNFVANGIVVHNSGLEQMFAGFTRLTLRPILNEVVQSVRMQLLTQAEKKTLVAVYDLDDLMAGDSQAMANLLSTLSQNGILDRNEAREKVGLEPREGGDALTVQSNLIPLERLGESTTSTPADDLAKSLKNFIRAAAAEESKP